MNGQKSSSINVVLMALVGVLIGFIGGYLVGQRGVVAGANPGVVGQGGVVNCPHELDAKDRWIIAGFRCPNTDTEQLPLLGCHCNTAHGIEDMVKSRLAAGETGVAIRDALVAQYGDRLKFKGQ